MTHTFEAAAQVEQAAWKQRTNTLTDEAREPAPYFRDGVAKGSYAYCLPRTFAACNLLPDLRADALTLFAAESIRWHAELDNGPTNHLLSSQIQCVNALMLMASDPARIVRAFAGILDLAEPLPVEADRYLAFEYIGAADHLGEAKPGVPRSRGEYCTSADAAIRYRRTDGVIEIALIEWKFTEHYTAKSLSKSRGTDRFERYRALAHDPEGSLTFDVVPYEDLFVEPFYQLMRQQLLASAMESAGELGAEVVRVVHVAPKANLAYQASLLRPSHEAAGASVYDVWRRVVRKQDRFVTVDSEIFCDPRITSAEYADRYGLLLGA